VDMPALRSLACVVLPGGFADGGTTVGGGLYAVLRYQGPYATMHSAYRWLYGDWLVRSGHEAMDGPVIEEYLNDPRNTPPTELLTDIFLPLRG
jgi:AraC family transcriptional regulator